MDLSVGSVLPEAWVDAVASNLLVLGGTTGGLNTGALEITGNLSVGGAVSAANGLFVVPPALAGNVQTGVYANVAGTATATVEITGVAGYAYTATAFTATTVAQFHAYNPAKAVGSTITTECGVFVEGQTQGTNNYGILVGPPSGGAGNNFGIYVQGGSPGIYVGAGGLTVNAGITQLTGNVQIGAQGANYASTGAARFASAQAIGWRNNANSGDIVLGTDATDRLVFSGGIATVTSVGAAGGATALPATPVGYAQVNWNGSNVKIPLYNP